MNSGDSEARDGRHRTDKDGFATRAPVSRCFQ